MDELKLILSTKFMRGIVTKLISRLILNKLGYDIKLQLNKLQVETADGKVYLHADVDAEIDNEEFIKIIDSIK